MFLNNQQRYANDLLRARGYLYLNDVYEALGFDKTKAGQVVGWKTNLEGGTFINFNIYDGNREASRNFVNGYERSILLDFNVEGNIWDDMEDDGRKVKKTK